MSAAVEAQNLNPWTARKIPINKSLKLSKFDVKYFRHREGYKNNKIMKNACSP